MSASLRPYLRLALRRPALLPAMISAAWAFRARGWHRRPPFLPLPSRAYMEWRAETAYGDPGAEAPPDEIARFLVWSRRMRRRMRRPSGTRLRVKLAALAAVAALAVWANLWAADNETLLRAAASAGYGGLFGVAAVSGFNFVAPVPVVVFYPFLMESGFAPIPTIAVIAVGMTAGDLLGYMIGSASRDVPLARLAALEARVEALRLRHPFLPYLLLFVYAAAVPLPNELAVVPLAFSGCSLFGVMSSVLLGNAIFNAAVAHGLVWIFGTQ